MKFLLFGTGDYYQRFKKWFQIDDILALVDNAKKKQHTFIDEIEVLSPEEAIKLPFDVVVILSFYYKEMKAQMSALGIPDHKIYHFYDLHRLIYKADMRHPIQYFLDADNIKLKSDNKKKILLLSQDLTLGGPAIALFHLAEVLLKHGYTVIYESMMDGPLKEKIISKNIPVIVDENLQIETMNDAGISNYDLIICNTINFHVFLSERDTTIPVIWWLHDSEFFYDAIRHDVMEKLDKANLMVLSVGKVPEQAFHKFCPEIPVKQLLYGVRDISKRIEDIHKKSEKIVFVTIGYIEARKGQDILVSAVKQLPKNVRLNAEFYFVGEKSSLMAQQIEKDVEDIKEIILTGPVNRDEIIQIFQNADVLICPSREDPMPTVCAEAMMFHVPCIVSDATGTSNYIQDGVNGLVFPEGNIEALTEKIKWCVKNEDMLPALGTQARKLFENKFSMKVFESEVLNTVREFFSVCEER